MGVVRYVCVWGGGAGGEVRFGGGVGVGRRGGGLHRNQALKSLD